MLRALAETEGVRNEASPPMTATILTVVDRAKVLRKITPRRARTRKASRASHPRHTGPLRRPVHSAQH